ncbi:integrase [Pseudomonas chlororaphis]|uniref:integrase n=1 Tax=Pseudomonas chlororaphis TaxID=587753 RepID=UPI00236562AA|nr:integrase [Pseudomonas chlororaphis]WDH22100.1 integrase [Pseudomonas chlororaphis]
MDDKVVVFKPRAEQIAEDNLREFITLARETLTTFGSQLVFDADSWDVTNFIRLKRRNSRSSIRFYGFPSGRGRKDYRCLPQPYKDFAKAYCRYDYGLCAYTTVSSRLAALRSLAVALEETEDCVTPVNAGLGHFNRACAILNERYQASAAYFAGVELKRISQFLAEHRLCTAPLQWQNPLRAPPSLGRRVGPEFDASRHARLPSPASLEAIAEIFGTADKPGDIFTSSVCALLASAPSRINELLSISIQCEVDEIDTKTGQQLYGIRWLPSKRGKAQVKWVVQSMASVAREAVSKLRTISTPAREVARWYEQHPTAMYLPMELEWQRGRTLISAEQVSTIVFLTPPPNGNHTERGAGWCRKKGIVEHIPYDPQKKHAPRFLFADIERVIISMLPAKFPLADQKSKLKYSEALCLTRLNELTEAWGTYRGVIVLPDTVYIQKQLTNSRTDLNIFERFGYRESDGSRMKITTHQFRHFLNTVAQMGGLSQLDIAKWSGRAKVGQNRCYDHQSDRDVLALARSALGDPEKSAGHVASIPPSSLIARDQFAALKIMTAHTTDLGYCLHDFSMLPCQLYRDCLNCDEHVCIKGEVAREDAIRQHRQELQLLLAKAKEALGEEFGANRWVEHQTLTLKRLDELCAIFEDSSVAANAIIQPRGVVPASRLEQLLAHHQIVKERELQGPTIEDPNVPRIEAKDL